MFGPVTTSIRRSVGRYPGADVTGIRRDRAQREQHVQGRQRFRRRLQPLGVGTRLLPHLLEQVVFQLLGPLARAEHGGLLLLQLRRDVALGVLEGLLADVVIGHLVPVRVGHFDVVAEHLVEADLQAGDAGAGRLFGLEPGDPGLPFAGGATQVVEFGAESVPDDAALGDEGRRVGLDTGGDQALHFGHGVYGLRQLREHIGLAGRQVLFQLRQTGQGLPQRHQVPGVGTAAVDLRGQAFDVGYASQLAGQLLAELAAAVEFLHGVQAALDIFGLAQRGQDPALQQPRAHRRYRPVEHMEQTSLVSGPAHGLSKFEAALRGAVQDEIPVAGEGLNLADVAQGRLLRLLEVGEDGARGAQGRPHVLTAEAVQRLRAEVPVQPPAPFVRVELPGRTTGHQAPLRQVSQDLLGPRRGRDRAIQSSIVALRQEALGGRDALQTAGQRLGFHFLDLELAGREVGPGEPDQRVARRDRSQEVVRPAVQYLVFRQRAGRDDARHVPFHQTGGLGRVLHLLADGHAVSGPYEALDVGVGGVVGEPGHGHGVLPLVPAREGQPEVPRADPRVLQEHLVKIPHAEKQNGVLVLLLEGQVLLHHRCLNGFTHLLGRPQESGLSSRRAKDIGCLSRCQSAGSASRTGPHADGKARGNLRPALLAFRRNGPGVGFQEKAT